MHAARVPVTIGGAPAFGLRRLAGLAVWQFLAACLVVISVAPVALCLWFAGLVALASTEPTPPTA